MFQVNPLLALFSLKDKSKKLKCLLQFLFGALRLKTYFIIVTIKRDTDSNLIYKIK